MVTNNIFIIGINPIKNTPNIIPNLPIIFKGTGQNITGINPKNTDTQKGQIYKIL